MFLSFSPTWKHSSSVNVVITNVKHVRVELKISSHEASQSDYGGGCGTDIRASSLNQGGGGGTGLCDRLAAVDSRSRKAYARF